MDIVVANILAEVILLFPEDVYRALKPGGIFIASGIIEDKAKVVEEALKRLGLLLKKWSNKGTGLRLFPNQEWNKCNVIL